MSSVVDASKVEVQSRAAYVDASESHKVTATVPSKSHVGMTKECT